MNSENCRESRLRSLIFSIIENKLKAPTSLLFNVFYVSDLTSLLLTLTNRHSEKSKVGVLYFRSAVFTMNDV